MIMYGLLQRMGEENSSTQKYREILAERNEKLPEKGMDACATCTAPWRSTCALPHTWKSHRKHRAVEEDEGWGTSQG